jgi:hypothetical protein
MDKRLAAIATLVAAVAAGGLFATTSDSAGNPLSCDPSFGCPVYLTGSGPSPTRLTMNALEYVRFHNGDSVPHTVVFANGLCSLTVSEGQSDRDQGAVCANRFLDYVGRYAYTVDGTFNGAVVTTPLTRSVSLTARTHTIRPGTRLTLRGRVIRSYLNGAGTAPPPPVLVLARHSSKQPFEPVATVRTRSQGILSNYRATYGWSAHVQPEAATTYIVEVTAQRLCYFPASRCAHPHRQVWANAKSRPFTVRVRH